MSTNMEDAKTVRLVFRALMDSEVFASLLSETTSHDVSVVFEGSDGCQYQLVYYISDPPGFEVQPQSGDEGEVGHAYPEARQLMECSNEFIVCVMQNALMDWITAALEAKKQLQRVQAAATALLEHLQEETERLEVE
jgi:hypothetical protein